jgi:GAF domain-containing protein
LQNFAAQAVIAMENARLITETREALEQQIATAEVLGVINASPGDLAPVFGAMLEKAVRLCEFPFAALWTYDGTHFAPVAFHNMPPPFEAFLHEHTPPGLEALRDAAGPMHLPDVMATGLAQRDPVFTRKVQELAQLRTLLLVPLRKDNALLGAFVAYRQEVRPFSDKQISLLQNFAAQAVIAMDNARLLGELHERTTDLEQSLEYQTATAEVLRIVASSPEDLNRVFEAMLDRATVLCDARAGNLWLYDGGALNPVATRNPDPEVAAQFLNNPVQPGPKTPIVHAMQNKAPVHIPDEASDDAYHAGDPFRVRSVEQLGVRSLLAVPLLKSGEAVGAMAIYRTVWQPFSDDQITLLKTFADQAVIAIENARLLSELRERTSDLEESLEYQTATSDVLKVISRSTSDLQPVLDSVAQTAARLCDAALAAIAIRQGDVYRYVSLFSVNEEWDRLARRLSILPGRDTVAGRTLLTGEAVHIPDLAADPEYAVPEAVSIGGLRTTLGVPLLRKGERFGVIVVSRHRVESFSERQIALVRTFADQAVIAMENARLITETREALEQQTATAEVLRVINSSPGDLGPVFDAMLEKALALCGADEGALRIFDGETFHLAAVHGAEPAQVARLQQLGPIRGVELLGRLARGERVVHVLDVRETETYRNDPKARERLEVRGIRTFLAVALQKENALLGALVIHRKEVRSFSDKQIALLQNFASQAVIAMENARLLGELRQRTEEVAELNRGLEARVAEQVEELGRVGRLKRFLAPQLAELIVSQGDEKILESHRREIVVVFCDLRGYTAFTETAEPEEVLDFLREYHGALGPLVSQFEGTLDQFSGDGIMVFFNDPVPIPDPAERAVKMAMAMREAAAELIAAWRRRGRMLGFGAGIAQGYATLGQIGFADRSGYTAIGTVCNLAARLCAEAKDGQILIAQRVAVATEKITALEEVGELSLKGLTQPVVAFNVPLAANQPALRVIEGGPERA